MKALRSASLLALVIAMSVPVAHAEEGTALPKQHWSFDGLRANWDKQQLYRGYQVATQVCMNCHSFKYISHRDLMRAGFTKEEVDAMAKALNKKLDDKLISPLDEETAKESYGKVPPDLSLMTKAREGGADYVYGVLTGFSDNKELIAHDFPQGLPANAYYNTVFPGHAIAMPSPLSAPDLVTYSDGTSATVVQMAKDVSTFLQWTAEPEKMERQQLGVFVLLYLFLFSILAYLTKRVIWRDLH